MDKIVEVRTIDEEFEKARVKAHIRTRKGKLERVSEFERKGEKRSVTIYDEDSAIRSAIKAIEQGAKIHGLPEGAKVKNFEVHEGESDEWSDKGTWLRGEVWGHLDVITKEGKKERLGLFARISNGRVGKIRVDEKGD